MKILNHICILVSFMCLVLLIRAQDEEKTQFTREETSNEDEQSTSETQSDAQNIITINDDSNQSTATNNDENSDGIITSESSIEIEYTSNSNESPTEEPKNNELNVENIRETLSPNRNESSSLITTLDTVVEKLVELTNSTQNYTFTDSNVNNNYINYTTESLQETTFQIVNKENNSSNSLNNFQQEDVITVELNDEITTTVESITSIENTDLNYMSTLDDDNGSGDTTEYTVISLSSKSPNETDSVFSKNDTFECQEFEFNCDLNKCINLTQQCNGIIDCDDGTDEVCNTTIASTEEITTTTTTIITTTSTVMPDIILSLEPNVETIEIREGSSLTISCKATGRLENLQTVFYKDQAPLAQSENGSVEIAISNAKLDNEGEYLCYGYPVDRSTYNVTSIKVVVLTDRPRPRPKPNKESKLIRVGEVDKTIDLSCDYSSNEQVKWRKVDGELSDYSREHNGVLYVYYLKDKDSGEYECYLPDGRSARVKLNVRDPASPDPINEYEDVDDQYAVRAYVEKTKIELNYGQNEEQVCTGMTNGQTLNIEWYNPRGQLIQQNGNFKISTEQTNDQTLTKISRLSILNFNPYNSGTYECRAVIGRQKSVVKFDVEQANSYTTKPTVQSEVCDIQEATCRNGQCISRSSLCDGVRDCNDGSDETNCVGKCEPNEKKCRNGKCIQKIWYCDGENDCGDNSDEDQCPKLIPGEKCHTNEFLCRNGEQCVLKGFVCDSENDCLDNSDETGCEQPRITRGPTRNLSVIIGGTIRIECQATGFPEPFINWRLNWGHVCEEPRCTSTSRNGTGVLTIKNARQSDAGAYSCEALNSRGRLFAIPDAIVNVYDSGRRPDQEESCNIDGSLNRYPPCRCKPNFAGYYCNECKEKQFIMSKSKGCVSCFCNGLNVNCKSSSLYYKSIQSNFFRDSEDWSISDISNSVNAFVSWNRGSIEFSLFSDYPDQELYFVAPRKFLENKLASYGGNLSFTIRFEGSSKDRPKKLNVRLSGSGYNIIYSHSVSVFSSYRDHKILINLNEDNFKQLETDSTITREKFLMILSNIEKLLISASFVNQQYATKLSDVNMNYAEEKTYILNNHKASAVEVCECPEGYTGLSCESCAPGYKRIKSGYYLGFCEREYSPNKNEVSLVIDVPDNRLVLRPGQTHVIYVKVTGGGSAIWYRESDNRLPPGVRQENNNLVIDNAVPDISGNYICIVYTPTGELKEIVVIQVSPDDDSNRRVQPTIYSSNQRTTRVRLGQPFVLECVANGYPVPSIRIESPMDKPSALAVKLPNQANNRAKYEISYFTSQNVGEYKCIAENEYGDKAIETFFVIQDYEITEPPSVRIEPRILDVSEGSNIILNFTYTGSEPVNIRIQLYGSGQLQQSNLIVDKNARKIEIKDVTKEMEGQYIITASNAYGSQNDYFQLRVEEAPSPKISYPETVIRIDENSQLKIEPRVQYSGQPSFRWTKDNGPLPNNAQINGYILYIPQIKKENEGVYALALDDKFGSARIQVRVIVEEKQQQTSSRKPLSIKRIHVKEDTVVELTPGETAYLLCNLKPKVSNPKVFSVTSWFKGSQTQKEKFPSNLRPNQEQLQIIKFKPSNVGAYTCTQVLSDGSSQSIVVNLVLKNDQSIPPSARIVNKNKNEINVGDSLDISCSVSGSPIPQVFWLFNNQQINMSNVYPAGDVLSIRNAQFNLNGYITCRAFNSEGQIADDTMYLTVSESKPESFSVEIIPQSLTVQAGESSKFTCNLIDQNTGLQYRNLRVIWSKQSGQLSSSTTQTSNGELNLYNLQERDTGTYICQIEDTNSGKTYSASASLNVLYEIEPTQPLTVTVTADSTNLLQGRDAELVCTVTGGKNPTISWKKISTNLDPERHVSSGIKLLIKNVQLEDRDYFECKAESEDGQTITNYILIQVEAREPPKLTIRPDNEIQVNYGSVAYAQCHASGIPSPTIEWKRVDGKPISSKVVITQEGSLLQIQEAGDEELGRYECVARNIEGVASEEINFVGVGQERQETSTVYDNYEEERRRQQEAEEEERRRQQEEDEKDKEKQRQPPNVIVQNNYVQVVEGQTATLNCYTLSNQPYRIHWLGPNDDYLETNDGNLIIANSRRSQSGSYKCVITNSYGKNSASVELNVNNNNNEKTEELKVQINPKSKKVAPGGSVEFKCNVNTKDKDVFIQWSRSGHVPFSQYHKINGNILKIENVQKEDHGRYQCTVTTSDGRIDFDAAFLQVLEPNNKFPVYIKVLEKPTEYNPPEYQYGVKITAECVAQSKDIKEISWYKVEGGVNRATYITELNKNTMKMEALVVMDLGTYVCMATRYDGAKAQNSITFNRSPLHGNRFEIKIEGPSEPLEDVPQEEVTEPVINTEEDVYEPTSPPISDAPSSPVVKISNEDSIDKFEGESLELTCQVTGNPTPTIQWNKDNTESKKTYRVVDNTLYVDRLKQSDSGYYMCYGENSEGRERAYIYVNVQTRPDQLSTVGPTQPVVITTTVSQESVEETSPSHELSNEKDERTPLVFIKSRAVAPISPGVELTFSCYVSKTSDIESELNVKFSKPDSSELDSERISLNKLPDVDFDRYDLTFTPFLETDAGQYKCTASNKYGQSSDVAYVEKELDDSFVFKTKNFNNKNETVENVKISVRGEIVDKFIVEISCQLQADSKAKYYQWARYENFPKTTHQSNNTLFINSFTNADNGIYGCKVTTDDNREFYGSKLIASNDYLLGDNPFFTFSREHKDYITVNCRPSFKSQIRWKTPDKSVDPKANFELDGDELHLYQTDGVHTYSCVLPSDNEYGSIVLDLEVNRDLLDKAFDLKVEEKTNNNVDETNDTQNDPTNVECTPDCITTTSTTTNNSNKKPKAKIIPIYIDTREGGKIDLKCEAENEEVEIKSFKWIQNDRFLSSSQVIQPEENGYYECQIDTVNGYASTFYDFNIQSISFELIDKNSIERLEILCETDQKANNSWRLIDTSLAFHSTIKGNKLVLKSLLNESDLANFECVSDNGHFKMNKKLSLNALNEMKKTFSTVKLLQDKKVNKSNKYLIQLPDLNIDSKYSNNQVSLKCHISTDELSLRLEKYSFNFNLEYQSEVFYDSGYNKVNQTDEVFDSIKNTYLKTYTCLASNILLKKLITKTKYLMSKNGESFLIRYIYTDFCDLPIRVFEFDANHFENILFKVNSDLCYTVEWLDSNYNIIQTGFLFQRSKLPSNEIVYLKFNLINYPQRLILKLKQAELINLNKTNQNILSQSIDDNLIEIQVITSPGYVKLECISNIKNADYKWTFLNGTFSNNAQINNNILLIEPFSYENIGVYQCLAYNLQLNQNILRRVILNSSQDIFDLSKRIRVDLVTKELKRNQTVILQCSIDISNMSVYWVKRGAKFSNRAQIESSNQFSKTTLIINRFQPEDLGIYICKLKASKFNYIGEKKIYLMASQFSDIESKEQILFNPDIDLKVLCKNCNIFKPFEISCDIKNFDTRYPELVIHSVDWKKSDGTKIDQNTKYQIVNKSHTNRILKIENLISNHEAYSCYAFTSTGSIKQTIEINKTISNYTFKINKPKPKFINLAIETKTNNLKFNQTHVFECITETYQLEWFRLNGQFSRNLKLIGNRILIYPYVDAIDSGTYKCTAYHDDDHSSSATIIIKRTNQSEQTELNDFLIKQKIKPIIYLTPNLNENFVYDSFVKIDCNTTTTQSNNVESIEWIRLQDDMSERTYVKGNSLTINNFKTDDLGKYSCIVSNDAGYAIKTIKFYDNDGIVSYRIDEQKEVDYSSNSNTLDKRLNFLIGSFTFNINEPFSVECFDLYGNVNIKPEWKKLNSNMTVTNPSTPHILYIPKFGLNDAGIYYCQTTNQSSGLLDYVAFKLSVNDHGRVNLNKLDSSILFQNRLPYVHISIVDKIALSRSESVKFQCTTDKDSKLKWMKVKNEYKDEFLTNKPSLKLAPIMPSDLGTYKCEASNSFGTSTSYVTIESSPKNGIHYDSLIYAYIDNKSTQQTQVAHLKKLHNNHNDDDVLRVQNLGDFNANESIILICYTGNWSLTDTRSNIIIRDNILEINKLQVENYGTYNCVNTLRGYKISYLIKPNKKGITIGRINEIELENGSKLSLLTPIENLNQNSHIKLSCSSNKQQIMEWFLDNQRINTNKIILKINKLSINKVYKCNNEIGIEFKTGLNKQNNSSILGELKLISHKTKFYYFIQIKNP